MIREAIKRNPFIHFGFNKQEKTVYINESFEIWQDTVYKQGYNAILTGAGFSIIETGINKSIIKANSLGLKSILFIIEDEGKTLSLESNIITFNVVEITADAKRITADSNNITADGSFI